MLTVSKALSSGQAQKYHKLEFTSKSQSYYQQGDVVRGEWQGKLAASLGLRGDVAPLSSPGLRTEFIHTPKPQWFGTDWQWSTRTRTVR